MDTFQAALKDSFSKDDGPNKRNKEQITKYVHKILNQKGFAAMEAMLVVVILAIVGGTGYYVYQANNKATETQNQAQTNANTAAPHKKNEKKSKPATAIEYLVVKEWGVELPLSSGIKDAYYIYDSNGYARLGTRSLTAMSAKCAPDKVGVSVLSRQTVATHNANAQQSEPSWDHPVYNTKLGNYYYGITHAQAACGNTTNSPESKQQATDSKLFDTAFNGIRAVQ